MARQKKDAVVINMKLLRSIAEELEKYCEETGQSKTMAIERMVDNELKIYFSQEEGKRVPR